MKKNKLFLYFIIGIVVFCIVGAAFAYWKGNQPKITYYPNGSVKTSVQRTFFKENGELLAYNPDGTLSGKFNVTDGIKNGAAHIYLNGVTLDINYNNGQWEGPIKIDTKGLFEDIEKANINIDSNRNLTLSDKFNDSNLTIKTKLACEDNRFFDSIQNFINNRNNQTFVEFAGCLDFNKLEVADNDFACLLNGSFQYPNFKSDTTLTCEDKNNLASAFMAPAAAGGFGDIEGLGNFKMTLNYVKKDNIFQLKISDSNDKYSQVQNFSGIEKIIPNIAEFAFSKQEGKDLAKLASSLIKDFKSGNSSVVVGGRKVFESIGEFSIEDGFSNPWTASFYGLNKNITSQMKVTDKGTIMNIAYPISNKPMLSFGIKFHEKLKVKYKALLNDIIEEFENNSEDDAISHLAQKMPKYAMTFSDVINSFSGLLMNNKGEKLLGVVINTKKGINFETLMEEPENAFNAKIVTYKNNAVDKVINGDVQKGFMVGNKHIDAEELFSYIDFNVIESTLKDIENEFAQAYKLMQKEKYPADPFIFGFYSGYSSAMNKYRANKILDQISMLATNIKTMYAEQGNYGQLNTLLARNLGIFSSDMLDERNIPVNVYKGPVLVTASKAQSGDIENTSFTLRFDKLPQETCLTIATSGIEGYSDEGIIAIGINKDLADAFGDHCVTGDGILCVNDHNSSDDLYFEAMKGCAEENVMFFKFK